MGSFSLLYKTTVQFIARSFFFLLYQFLRHRYEKIEIAFIAHTTEAEIVDEEKFFKRVASGGTHISSAPKLALELVNDRYHPSSWNIYAFHCTDGDNWDEDNDAAPRRELVIELFVHVAADIVPIIVGLDLLTVVPSPNRP